jgi:hypothetical protein
MEMRRIRLDLLSLARRRRKISVLLNQALMVQMATLRQPYKALSLTWR